MGLKETVAKIVREEMGECIEEDMHFTGSYEGEEFNVIIKLRYEPEDFEKRNARLYDRVWELGYDVGIFMEYPEETITV